MPTVSVSKNCPIRNSENCRGKRDISSSESLGFETRVKGTNKFIGLWEVCVLCVPVPGPTRKDMQKWTDTIMQKCVYYSLRV